MKRMFFASILCLLAIARTSAQRVPLAKYDVAPWTYEHVFLDMVQDYRSVLIDVNGGQYVGQANKRHALYGYGQYINDAGDIMIGKFRQGDLILGITVRKDHATVGDKDFYCNYNLATGELQYIAKRGTRTIPDSTIAADYTFMSQTFENGDRYVGEFYQGKRHGIGIYYYATGGLWFGTFDNDVRNGFGAWFKPDNDMVIGLWEGEDERRTIYIPLK